MHVIGYLRLNAPPSNREGISKVETIFSGADAPEIAFERENHVQIYFIQHIYTAKYTQGVTFILMKQNIPRNLVNFCFDLTALQSHIIKLGHHI